jgi:hypothetical protein
MERKDTERNNSIPLRERTQPFTHDFEEDQMWYFGATKNVDPGPTSCRHKYACHPKAPPAPDPVKLDPNLSLLGGDTTSTPASKFSFNLYYDAVDWDLNVERFFATVKQQFVNQTQVGNKTYLVVHVANFSLNHGEHLDQEFKSWHGINDISCHSVTGNLYQHRLILVDWYLKHVHIKSARADSMFRAIGGFADQITHQWEESFHLGLSAHNKRFMCEGNQVAAMSSSTSQSLLKRKHEASTYHHIIELIA